MNITIEGTDYELNISKAIADGYLKKIPKSRSVSPKDIPNGSIFKWNRKMYLMVDNTIEKNGQCVCVSDVEPYNTWFRNGDELTEFTYWDMKEQKWISKIDIK